MKYPFAILAAAIAAGGFAAGTPADSAGNPPAAKSEKKPLAKPEIVKVEPEPLPERRLIGRRHTNSDRGKDGGFGNQWDRWHRDRGADPLDELMLPGTKVSAPLGFMQGGKDGFEYWIGHFCRPDAPVPDGYEFADFPASDCVIVSIKARQDDGKIFAMHDACVKAAKAAGFKTDRMTSVFERYQRSFIEPDEDGNIILEYGLVLGKP